MMKYIALLLALMLLIPAALAQEGDKYTYTVVGGEEQNQVYDDQEIEGFTISNFTYRSLYPFGLEFKATITPPEDVTIASVTMFYSFTNSGTRSRIPARLSGEAENEWIAIPYEGAGLPPWHEIDVVWGIRAGDISVDSEPAHAVYYDLTREWFRAESEDIIIYWFDMPTDLGKLVIEAMETSRPLYLAGFGELLPYRPLAVIFPPGPIWNEYRGDDDIEDTQFGFTGTIISEAGSAIQRVRTLEPAVIRQDCVWNPVDPDVTWQMEYVASTVTHEVAHLYQNYIGIGGPTWWVEGQASFFENIDEYPIHDRVRGVGELRDGDLPSLQGTGPSGGPFLPAEDGCTHLAYDMGKSFMRWIVEAQGGMQTYNAIVEELKKGSRLADALLVATGQTFVELENQWRAFLGFGEIPADVLDPGAALTEADNPTFAVGDTLTTPGFPIMLPLNSVPKDPAVMNGPCPAGSDITILRSGFDGTTNWYEVECLGLNGWVQEGSLSQ